LGPIPNPQSPIPNPQSPKVIILYKIKLIYLLSLINIIIDNKLNIK